MYILLHLAALAVAFLALAKFLPDFEVKGAGTAIVVAVVFSVLNFLLGWLIYVLLFVPGMLTLGLLFFFIPFIVNTVMLWLTDKLIARFEIKSVRALLVSAACITVVNWLFRGWQHAHRLQPHRW